MPARQPLRRAWIWVHKWLGLLTAVIMLLVALTGSVLTYEREIDIALNPQLFTPSIGSARVNADTVMQVAAASDRVPIHSLTPPAADWPVWSSYHRHTDRGEITYWQTFIDPVTGEVLGRRNASWTTMRTISQLHYCLLLRPWWGRELIGVLGILLLISTLSGLYLWWPRTGFWQATVTVHRRPRQRLLLDLHNVVGVWSAIVLVVVAFSGVYLIFPGLVRPAVGVFSAIERPAPVTVPPGEGSPGITADLAMAAAMAARPRETVATITPPSPARNTWLVAMRGPGDVMLRSGTQVFVDPWRGTVVRVDAWEQRSAGGRFEAIQFALHNGSYFGATGRILVCLSGLGLTAMVITGVWLWLRKRSVRQELQHRRTALLVTGSTR